jgi:hypothetical protein
MQRALIAVAIAAVFAGCATTPPAPLAPAPAAAPVLRLLEITPSIGLRVDSTTMVVARLAYHIPDYDPAAKWVIMPMFAGMDRVSMNPGITPTEIRSPAGVVTIRQPLKQLWSSQVFRPAQPLTGRFFLMRMDTSGGPTDTVHIGGRVRIRRVASAPVRAQSRTFFYNGSGPSRSFGGPPTDVLEDYWAYRPHKAFAIAYQSAARWTYGYAFGYDSPEGAIERALQECRASAALRGVDAACHILAVNDAEAETEQ